MDAVLTKQARDYRSERIFHYLQKGADFDAAIEEADLDLMKWQDGPLPLPEMPLEAWT